ncbi:hypothetical protein M885DRAFT_624732 [Pelagophyceae sp. CCMP2097]|nr:hypothetical protein M885DRAFT_624732 [Pelagophyceae sp. CCMP2097]
MEPKGAGPAAHTGATFGRVALCLVAAASAAIALRAAGGARRGAAPAPGAPRSLEGPSVDAAAHGGPEGAGYTTAFSTTAAARASNLLRDGHLDTPVAAAARADAEAAAPGGAPRFELQSSSPRGGGAAAAHAAAHLGARRATIEANDDGSCSVTSAEYSALLMTNVYPAALCVAFAADIYFPDCPTTFGVTKEDCAFAQCATCGFFDDCKGLDNTKPYADCVTCEAGFEVDVVYDDCSGACVKEGLALRTQAECTCAAELSAAAFDGTATGTCTPTAAPTLSPVPTPVPTRAPTPVPTPAPSAACDAADICWADTSVAAFDCDVNGNPVQVMKVSGESFYSVRELDITTGEYDLLYDLEYFTGHVNAVAMLGSNLPSGAEAFYAFGSFSGLLCRFDAVGKVCFSTALEYDKPNVGVMVGNNYYYAHNPGIDDDAAMFVVEGLNSDSPMFSAVANFYFSTDLFTNGVLDVAALGATADAVVGGNRVYLVGLGGAFEVVVIRLNEDGFLPEAYAVIADVSVDFAGATSFATGVFGAAFAYGDDQVLFAVNEGSGLFTLDLPLTIAEACWNTGLDVSTHAVCADSSAQITRVTSADVASSNDGMNCPLDALIFCDEACWVDPSAGLFDCGVNSNPVQVALVAGETHYIVGELDTATGTYETLYTMTYFTGHVNAVAMMRANGDYYSFGSFSGKLCRFDATGLTCFAGALQYSKPNVGAIVGFNYYYSKNPGADVGAGMHFVSDVNTEAPTFVTDITLEYSTTLFQSAVLDVAALVEPAGETYIDDDEAEGTYLIGLAEAFEVVVTRIDAITGYADAYAVVTDVSVDWGTAALESGAVAFGAAFAYGERLFFASNEGYGLFELLLPLTIPSTCWNTDTTVSAHAVCAGATASVVRVTASELHSSNDGLNCPDAVVDLKEPTAAPTPAPSAKPTPKLTPKPTLAPSSALAGAATPTAAPTSAPTLLPAVAPSAMPTAAPTTAPSAAPTTVPTAAPSEAPRVAPTAKPMAAPSSAPSSVPTAAPSSVPSAVPSSVPTPAPSSVPSAVPSSVPSPVPTAAPSSVPTPAPSSVPSAVPSSAPSPVPTAAPSPVPTAAPSSAPSPMPTKAPSAVPTSVPTEAPSAVPTSVPTEAPSAVPTSVPTEAPSSPPSAAPSSPPSSSPTAVPTTSSAPTLTLQPTGPSPMPTPRPTHLVPPSAVPTTMPLPAPTGLPTGLPSALPTALPTAPPTSAPTGLPTTAPTTSESFLAISSFVLDFGTLDPLESEGTLQVVSAALMAAMPKLSAVQDVQVSAASRRRRLLDDSATAIIVEVVVGFETPADLTAAEAKDALVADLLSAVDSGGLGAETLIATRALGADAGPLNDLSDAQLSSSVAVAASNRRIVAETALVVPSAAPTFAIRPTSAPSSTPSSNPTASPTAAPSATASPTAVPTLLPSRFPTSNPSSDPTSMPTLMPSLSPQPTSAPSSTPSSNPSSMPSSTPSSAPTAVPTAVPSAAPTEYSSSKKSSDDDVFPGFPLMPLLVLIALVLLCICVAGLIAYQVIAARKRKAEADFDSEFDDVPTMDKRGQAEEKAESDLAVALDLNDDKTFIAPPRYPPNSNRGIDLDIPAAVLDEDDTASQFDGSAANSDVFFSKLMLAAERGDKSAPTAEGEDVGAMDDLLDDEWQDMLNDVDDDDQSTETWNEDLSSMLLFRLAQQPGDPEGFASRAALAEHLEQRPDLVDMLGLQGISGGELEFLLSSVESLDGDADHVSRSQFLRALEQFRQADDGTPGRTSDAAPGAERPGFMDAAPPPAPVASAARLPPPPGATPSPGAPPPVPRGGGGYAVAAEYSRGNRWRLESAPRPAAARPAMEAPGPWDKSLMFARPRGQRRAPADAPTAEQRRASRRSASPVEPAYRTARPSPFSGIRRAREASRSPPPAAPETPQRAAPGAETPDKSHLDHIV